MTEKKLKELGFRREDVSDDESNNGYDYYYYCLELTEGFSLISCGNDELVHSKDNWYVYNFDWPNIKITKADHIHKLKEIIACSQQN